MTFRVLGMNQGMVCLWAFPAEHQQEHVHKQSCDNLPHVLWGQQRKQNLEDALRGQAWLPVAPAAPDHQRLHLARSQRDPGRVCAQARRRPSAREGKQKLPGVCEDLWLCLFFAGTLVGIV